MSGNSDQPDARMISALVLWASVGSAALVLVGRAIAGAFDEPVPAAIPLLATVVALLASLTAWTLFHQDQCRGDVGRRLWDGFVSVAPVAMIGYASCVNAAPTTLAVVSSLLICGLAYVVVWEALRPLSAIADAAETEDSNLVDPSLAGDQTGPPVMPLELASAAGLDQVTGASADPIHEQLSRRGLVGGGEQIEAVLIARFQPGQRQTAVHLPIHPVLPRVPHVECEPLDDPSVTTHVTAVHGYGVRVEVKRAQHLDAEEGVPIGLLITATQSGESAA